MPAGSAESLGSPAGSPSREAAGRLAFVDNVRWTMILLVISMHAADTYSPLGNWYYVERPPLSPLTLLFFAAWQSYLQSFFMGLLFLVAGVFVPASLDRRSPAGFLAERGFRLGLPVLFYMLVLGPITEYFFAHSWTSTEPTTFAREWVKHIYTGEVLQENGPLWFCLALLIFCAVYALCRALRRAPASAAHPWAPPGPAALTGFALGMAAATFMTDVLLPEKWGVLLNMHLRDFPQYVLMFVAGTLAGRGQWLTRLPARTVLRWAAFVLPLAAAAWLGLILGGGVLAPGGSRTLAGWHWQAAVRDLWEAFSCVALSGAVLVLFRARFNRQGPPERFLSANAFSVYVFHPPVVIGTARLLTLLRWHPLLKFFTLTVLAAVASFLLSAAVFRRIPLLRRIL
jgi:hypothetical protein